MGAMSPTHWLIVLGVLVLLFGAKKLPDMARSIGQSARVFKGEMKDLTDNTDTTTDASTDTAPAADAPEPKAVDPPAPASAATATVRPAETTADPAPGAEPGPAAKKP